MSDSLRTLASVVLASAAILSVASFALRAKTSPEEGPDAWREGVWRWIAGALIASLVLLNANQWWPGRGIFTALAVLAIVASIRLLVVSRGWLRWVAACSAAGIVAVLLAGSLTALRLDANHYWLLETANHDTLFYFEGARWAESEGVHADPGHVSEVLGLGNCRSGAVFIGSDCPVYRGGTYSMLAFAQHFGAGGSANDMQIGACIAVLMILLGLLPAFANALYTGRGVRGRETWLLAASPLALLVFFSPGMNGAALNSNVATMLGAGAIAMMVGLSLGAVDQHWRLRALALGLGAAIAAHCYGEASLPAVIIAATGVLADAIRLRSMRVFVLGGFVCAVAFLAAANVVVYQLWQSAREINAIASGGAWEGSYLHGAAWRWIAAPFAGLVVNGDPAVTRSMVILGLLQAGAVTFGVSLLRRTWMPALGLLAFAALMIGYLEVRDYAYGEHKVIQLIGAPASMLAVCVALALMKGPRNLVRKSLATLILVLLCASIVAQALPMRRIVEYWKGPHGLSRGFATSLPRVDPGQNVVLDDAAASGMERFQKSHYLVYLVHSRGGKVLIPELDEDGMRGGYARSVRGNSLAGSTQARWLLQLRAADGRQSPFRYPAGATRTSTEYDVIDLAAAGQMLAVSGAGWKACDASGCEVSPGFEIETLSWAGCEQPGIRIHAAGAADAWHTVVVTSDAGETTQSLNNGTLDLKVPEGWRRIRLGPSNGSTDALRITTVDVGCGKAARVPGS